MVNRETITPRGVYTCTFVPHPAGTLSIKDGETKFLGGWRRPRDYNIALSVKMINECIETGRTFYQETGRLPQRIHCCALERIGLAYTTAI